MKVLGWVLLGIGLLFLVAAVMATAVAMAKPTGNAAYDAGRIVGHFVCPAVFLIPAIILLARKPQEGRGPRRRGRDREWDDDRDWDDDREPRRRRRPRREGRYRRDRDDEDY
jgi:hypothetical protein